MRRAYSVEQVRRAEAALMAELPEGALMQRAVAGLAAQCVRLLAERRGGVYGARVVAVAGSGDNGGDALFAAAWLARRGAAVTAVVLDAGRVHGPGLAAVRAAGGRAVSGEAWSPSQTSGPDLVLDGVTGIGGRGGLRPLAERVFTLIEGCEPRPPVVAVDVPSGVDADSGEVSGPTVRADVTVTFGAYKPGLLVSPGAEAVGECRFVDIGLAPHLAGEPVLEALEAPDVEARRPRPQPESNKYRRGVVGVVAGSVRYPGAAVLVVGAALRSGVGAVRYVGPPEVSARVLDHFPETLVSASLLDTGRVQAWVLGPGIGRDSATPDLVKGVLRAEAPVLVDADALGVVADQGAKWLTGRRAPTLFTPHAGEAARLLGGDWTAEVIEARRVAAVRALAERYGCTTLLKGSTTLIAEPSRETIRVNPTGTPALATAGSGDVLAGLVGGLMAAGLDAYEAASVGAWRHGAAGIAAAAQSAGSMTAGDLVAVLGRG